ncbi:Uncharacterised protein [Mycobacteroides abscessus]|nr:Uncharacterised protein [Mycobacteroides abscessus]
MRLRVVVLPAGVSATVRSGMLLADGKTTTTVAYRFPSSVPASTQVASEALSAKTPSSMTSTASLSCATSRCQNDSAWA